MPTEQPIYNKDEAERVRDIGVATLHKGDANKAIWWFQKSKKLYHLDGIDEWIAKAEKQGNQGQSKSNVPPPTQQPSPKQAPPVEVQATYTEDQLSIVNKIIGFVDYYDKLSLSYTVTEVEEIKKQYRLLSKLVHPDKNKAPRAQQAFQELTVAKDCLISPVERSKYNITRLARQNTTNAFHTTNTRDNTYTYTNFNPTAQKKPTPSQNTHAHAHAHTHTHTTHTHTHTHTNAKNNYSKQQPPSPPRGQVLYWESNTHKPTANSPFTPTKCPTCFKNCQMNSATNLAFVRETLIAVCCFCLVPFSQVICPHCQSKYVIIYNPLHEGSDVTCSTKCGKSFKLRFPKPTPQQYAYSEKKHAEYMRYQQSQKEEAKKTQERAEAMRAERERILKQAEEANRRAEEQRKEAERKQREKEEEQRKKEALFKKEQERLLRERQEQAMREQQEREREERARKRTERITKIQEDTQKTQEEAVRLREARERELARQKELQQRVEAEKKKQDEEKKKKEAEREQRKRKEREEEEEEERERAEKLRKLHQLRRESEDIREQERREEEEEQARQAQEEKRELERQELLLRRRDELLKERMEERLREQERLRAQQSAPHAPHASPAKSANYGKRKDHSSSPTPTQVKTEPAHVKTEPNGAKRAKTEAAQVKTEPAHVKTEPAQAKTEDTPKRGRAQEPSASQESDNDFEETIFPTAKRAKKSPKTNAAAERKKQKQSAQPKTESAQPKTESAQTDFATAKAKAESPKSAPAKSPKIKTETPKVKTESPAKNPGAAKRKDLPTQKNTMFRYVVKNAK